jgi:hypothetical protein
MNGDGSGVRQRSHGDEAGDSATDSAKPYTSDQLDAVKKYVCVLIPFNRARMSSP